MILKGFSAIERKKNEPRSPKNSVAYFLSAENKNVVGREQNQTSLLLSECPWQSRDSHPAQKCGKTKVARGANATESDSCDRHRYLLSVLFGGGVKLSRTPKKQEFRKLTYVLCPQPCDVTRDGGRQTERK